MTFEQAGPARRPSPIAVILAGGRSRRMNGQDKGRIELCGKRLVDRVIERLRPQAARIFLSARGDYGTGLEYIPDLSGAPEGPAAGVWSAQKWLAAHHPDAEEFFTAPVDGPFLPRDLIDRLCAASGSAIASDGENDHPTFACWKLRDLAAAWPRLRVRPHISLRALGDACSARRIVWTEANVFLNINSPADLDRARRLMRQQDACHGL